MKYNKIEVNGTPIIAFDDGSIEKPFHGRTKRTFGTRLKDGYMITRVGDRKWLMHRIIAMAFGLDLSGGLQVDHINGNKSDNRLKNLRSVTNQFNSTAFRRVKSGASSKFRGVYWNKRKGKWHSRIKVNGKQKHIGYYNNEIGAALAYDEASKINGYPKESLNLK
jgi:hypothetical protein